MPSPINAIKRWNGSQWVSVWDDTGVKVLDSDGSHYLTVQTSSNLTASRTLTLATGDADRTLTLTGDATLNQDVSTAGSPSFVSVTTNQTTFNLANTTATTVNFAGAATALSIGASTGTTTVNHNLAVAGTATATTFSGSGASLTALPAAQLTGNAPASAVVGMILRGNLTPSQGTVVNSDTNWTSLASFTLASRPTNGVLLINWSVRGTSSDGTSRFVFQVREGSNVSTGTQVFQDLIVPPSTAANVVGYRHVPTGSSDASRTFHLAMQRSSGSGSFTTSSVGNTNAHFQYLWIPATAA